MAFFSEDFLRFFIELAPNNHKDWFDQHRQRYHRSVKDPFSAFVQHMIDLLAKEDPVFSDVQAKDCIFRINRDIRFSKDKSPYKLMVSAVVAPEGKKSKAINGIYFEFGPEHVRVYGGLYELDREEIEEIREGIAQNLTTFKKLYSQKEFVATFGSILGEKNKIIAKELRESAVNEPLLYNKQWYFFSEFEPEVLLNENLDTMLLSCYRIARPVERFLTQFIHK